MIQKAFFILIILFGVTIHLWSQNTDTTVILKFEMKEEVSPALWRKTQKAFEEAKAVNADVILIHMNTYGGLVESADSIRTKILNSKIPVYVFIDNNAASAGALISIACDRIYMRPGANIGAATVVNQTGEQLPDKYQSYMRSTMRATAEAQGKDTLIQGKDTTFTWKRDPRIAEAMVDADIYIAGIIDSGKVITFTASEAIKYGFCDGTAENIQEVIEKAALKPAVIKEYIPTGLDHLIGFLMNPVFQSILIMAIFGGIYFEFQTPGIGFPLIVAVTAAVLYFAPLYLEGIAQHWEIALFIVGLILIGIEIFAIPGFGVIGISGIVLAVFGLALAMVENFDFNTEGNGVFLPLLVKSLLLVVGSIFISFIGSIYFGSKMFETSFISRRIALNNTQETKQGYVGVDTRLKLLVRSIGITETPLRPSGSIIINGETNDARAEFGFIERGQSVKVTRFETNQLHVVKI
jgi:membrane-bound serine protease (ClpP class)